MKKYIHLILTVFLIGMMTISSFASDMYVYDEAGLLEAEELVSLDEEAAAISEKYGWVRRSRVYDKLMKQRECIHVSGSID